MSIRTCSRVANVVDDDDNDDDDAATWRDMQQFKISCLDNGMVGIHKLNSTCRVGGGWGDGCGFDIRVV